jgi:hypothetical protein
MRDIEQWLDPSFALDRSVMEGGCRSWLRVALLHRGKRIGIASMAARQCGFYTDEQTHP